MTDPASRSSRRDFLKGKSAVRAVENLGRQLTPDTDLGAAADLSGQPRSYLVQVERRAMACQFQVLLNAGQHDGAMEHALAALDLIDQLEAQLSVYRHRSEVSQLNSVAVHRPVQVEPRLFQLLENCLTLYEQTSGAFDITSGPLIRLWREVRREGRLPPSDTIDSTLRCVGSDKLQLDRQARSVRFLEAGVTIDLGGIGKGYALDRCAEHFASVDVSDYLIHGGSSSILARGERLAGGDRVGWTVGVQHPLRPDRRLLELDLVDRAVGTSGAGTHQFFVKGRRYGHILDPRSGYPVDGVLSTTVVAPQAAQADALSTSFYVIGLEGIEAYCREHVNVSALVTTAGRGAGIVDLHTFNCGDLVWRSVELE